MILIEKRSDATKEKKVLERDLELGLKEESGNVVAGAWARYGLYFE